MRTECGPGGVQLAVGSRQQAVCNRQCAADATCNVQTCSKQPACNVQQATCGWQQATCNAHRATCSSQTCGGLYERSARDRPSHMSVAVAAHSKHNGSNAEALRNGRKGTDVTARMLRVWMLAFAGNARMHSRVRSLSRVQGRARTISSATENSCIDGQRAANRRLWQTWAWRSRGASLWSCRRTSTASAT